jgi:hypothetical protein
LTLHFSFRSSLCAGAEGSEEMTPEKALEITRDELQRTKEQLERYKSRTALILRQAQILKKKKCTRLIAFV